MNVFMGAAPCGAEKRTIWGMINRVSGAVVIETDQILGINIVGGTGIEPV
jgi:hypothetical protein